MRVLVIAHLYPNRLQPSLGHFVRKQVEGLVERGHEVVVVSPRPFFVPGLPRGGATVPRVDEVGGVTVHYPRFFKLPGRLDLGTFGWFCHLGLARTVARIRRDFPFEMIHGHMAVPDGFAAVLLGRRYGVPVVVTERGYMNRYPDRDRFCRAAARFVVEGADQLVFVCRALADRAAALGTPRREPRIVYTGLDHAAFRPGDAVEARRELGLPEDGEIVLSVAQLVQKKGNVHLVRAFARVAGERPRALLVLVGSGRDEEMLRAEAAALGIAERVRFAGQQPGPRVARFMVAADVFALPSLKEGFPNVLLEASASGLPLVAAAVDGVPELVRDGDNGLLVPPADPSALAGALLRLLGDPAERARLAGAARHKATTEFSWTRHVDQMDGLYREMGARHGGGHPAAAGAGRLAPGAP